jgi:hypothetical protein
MACNSTYNVTAPRHFDLEYLWQATQNITSTCANDIRLIGLNKTQLNQRACLELSGTAKWSWMRFTPYPNSDIYSRLAAWKFPLIQLVIQFPRPPLGLGTELFALVHLVGDPMETISSLMYTLAVCQTQATFWRKVCGRASSHLQNQRTKRPGCDWKEFTLIAMSYEEWGKGS